MLGKVASLDYDGDVVTQVVLRFPPPPHEDKEKTITIRAYERIGQGAFGTVYRAESDQHPRLALKIATGKSTRLRQELDVLCRVCTKGKLLLPRFEFGALNADGDLAVIGMELCMPCTLHEFLLKNRLTSESDKLFIAYQAAQAVSYVHQEGCIHRDVKLQNFVFDLDGNIKLIDFGLACNSMTPPPGDVVAGTVAFMAPEMAYNAIHKEKRKSVGAAGDIWSLGIVLFSIFTQRNPYSMQDAAAPPSASSAFSQKSQGADSRGSSRRGRTEETGEDAPQGPSPAAAQLKLNEQLLRRVSSGEWQWPSGVSVSFDIKQLVNAILVADVSKRPSIDEILSMKVWNLRRRYTPQPLKAFLATEEDEWLLSHDEDHLLRAAEERSAFVTASLMHSRMQSPIVSDEEAEEEDEGDTFRPPEKKKRSSLKVIERKGDHADGVPAVEVYDVRASARKRSKPIRDIEKAIAEETAKGKRRRARRAPRDVVTAPPSRATSEEPPQMESRRASSTGASLTYTAHSTPSRRLSMALDVVESKNIADSPQNGARASLAAATVGSTDNSGEGAQEQSKQALKRRRSSRSTSLAKGLGSDFRECEDVAERGIGKRERMKRSRSTSSVRSRKKSRSALGAASAKEDPPTEEVPLAPLLAKTEEAEAEAERDDDDEQQLGDAGKAIPHRNGDALRRPTSSILAGVHRGAVRESYPRLQEEEEELIGHNGVQASVSHHRETPSDRGRRQTTAPRPWQLEVLQNAEALVAEEAARRRMSEGVLLLEHEWLLSSFALTFAEDQSRYNLEWVAREREVASGHRHRFREYAQPSSHLYPSGFLCDMCFHEFICDAFGTMQYFHCGCGMDLCNQCHAEYVRRCVCSCCYRQFRDSFSMRDHLFMTGGAQQHGLHAGMHYPKLSYAPPSPFPELSRPGRVARLIKREKPPALRRSRGRPRVISDNASSFLRMLQSTNMSAIPFLKKTRIPAPSAVKQEDFHDFNLSDDLIPSEDPGTGRMSIAAMQQEFFGEDAAVGKKSRMSKKEKEERQIQQMEALERQLRAQRLQQQQGGGSAGASVPRHGASVQRRSIAPEDLIVEQKTVDQVPEGPWRPFDRLRRDRGEAVQDPNVPTMEEREAVLNGEWIRHFYLFPDGAQPGYGAEEGDFEPYAFVYQAQPGRVGAVFLTSDFPVHSAVSSMLERQLFVVNQVDMAEGTDETNVVSLLRAKAVPEMKMALAALQEITAYDTNQMKQHRVPGVVSVAQAHRSAYSFNNAPYLYVRWFRFNESRTLSAFLLSNGAVQLFVGGEYELRWFDEARKFLVRANGVCEVVDDSTFPLTAEINHLLYDAFDE